MIIRTFLFQPFSIPSGSMKNTLLIGDYLLVSKYSYGYSTYSLPLNIYLFSGRIINTNQPKRGDIAVFKLPRDNKTNYIKRVIGLPGESIQINKGVIFINNKPIKRKLIKTFSTKNSKLYNKGKIYCFLETLPNGISYKILEHNSNSSWNNTQVYEIPKNHYFMMGDNRDNSIDSRFLSLVGYVPLENFIGKARILFFSINKNDKLWKFWKWYHQIRWSRIGKILH